MKFQSTLGRILTAVLVTGTLAFSASAPAYAGSCDGTVRGLSSTYNKAKGTGFLAVRARPTTNSRMKGELFNGDNVELYSRRGNWYEVGFDGLEGWSFHKYIRTSCDPNNP